MNKKNFYLLMKEFAMSNPNKKLLTVNENSVTYGEFIDKIDCIANRLKKLGVQKDSKIGLVLSNSLYWYEIFWAALKIGAQPVPMDPQSGILELERLFEFSDISYVFIEKKYRNNPIYEIVKELAPKVTRIKYFILVNADEQECEQPFMSYEEFLGLETEENAEVYDIENDHVMSLACTSGSTGNPKILSVPYEGFFDAIVDMGKHLEFKDTDVMMVGMPLYHQGGFGMGLQMVVNGGSVIYQPQFDPNKFLETVEKYKVSVIQLTATLAKILISHPDFYKFDLSSIRICYFAGEVLPQEIASIFVEKLGIRVINVIGSSETATMVVWDSAIDYAVDPSDFNELPFTKIHIIGEDGQPAELGELCIYTTAVIYNYYNNPEATKNAVVTIDGKRCFMTGDLVERQSDGRIHFLGRSKRIIKRGANLVHAEEVEGFLLTHPLIEAVAVVAEKHPVIGEQIVAYVQTRDNQNISRGDIAKHFAGKMSAYKIPDKVVVTEELPHDIGKIQFKYIGDRKK